MTIETHGLDTAECIYFYEQDFYVLSNFSAFCIKWKGRTFPTSEHAYHWEKFDGCIDAVNAGGNIATQVLNASVAENAMMIGKMRQCEIPLRNQKILTVIDAGGFQF